MKSMIMTHKSHLLRFRTLMTIAIAATLALPVASALHAAPPAQSGRLSSNALANAEYPLAGVPGDKVLLTDGEFKDAANNISVELNGPVANGDLNGDGATDAVVTLIANTGGSGTFSVLSAVLNVDGQAKPVDSVFLGDRIRVQRVGINDGVITVRYLDRRFDQPMSARPTIPVVQRYTLKDDKLVATGPLSSASLNHAEYFVTLVDGQPSGKEFFTRGRYSDPANQITASLATSPRATGDLNGDGAPDTAVIVTSNTGGTANFVFVQAVLNQDYVPQTVAAVLLGDRVRATDLDIENGQIQVTYLDREPNEPMSARPTVETTRTLALDGDQLVAPEDVGKAAPAPAAPAASAGVTYACSGGKSFTVVFGPQSAAVTFDGKTEQLAQSPSGDGFLYENSFWELRGVGASATLSDAQTKAALAEDCQSQTAAEDLSNASGAVSYACANSVTMTVSFGPSAAVVTLGDKTETLTPVQTESGVQYANDNWQLNAKDDAAALTDLKSGALAAEDCRVQAPAAAAPAQPELSGVLTGTVTYMQRIALPPNSLVTVQLADVSIADAAATVITSQTIETAGAQVPIPFELTYDPAAIDPRFTYAVSARITLDDQLTWISPDANLVLTGGSPVTGIDIMMQQAGASAPAEPTASAAATVVDALAGDARFTTLVSAVQAAGLVTPLKELPAVTVFAPTNEAFAALGESALKELQGNPSMLSGILTYHVVTPTLVASDVVQMTELQPLLQGFTIPVTVSGTQVMVKDATILQADITAGNGVIHVIDKVLTPVETFGMADPGETKNTVEFVCADDKPLSVTFDNAARTAEVTFDGQTRTLPQEPSGSGFRYADEVWVLAGKGNEVILTDAKTDATLAGECFVKGAASGPSMELTGSYVSGVLPAADASGRVITLTLSASGAAALETQFIGKGDPIVEEGAWAQADGNAVVTLTNTGGATNTLTFQPQGNDLVLLDPVEAGYGTAGLTLTRAGAEAEAAPAAPAAAGAVLTGTVTYRQKIALPDNAIVEVTLADVSRADAAATVIATQTIETLGAQVPIPFELTYDPAAIDPRMTYAVSARITVDGKLTWINDTRFAVLTRDAPVTGVDIVVIRVGATTTPATRARTARYTCDNGVTVTVRYSANSAEVTFDGKTQVLPQVESGDGIRYSNANWEWNSKGQEGFLTDRKSNTIVAANCRTK
jgi:uncharacterized lipoprotein YbaY